MSESEQNVSDMLTKSMTRKKLEAHKQGIGMVSIEESVLKFEHRQDNQVDELPLDVYNVVVDEDEQY